MFATVYSQQSIILPTRGSGETCGASALHEESSKKYGKIKDGLESSISMEGRARITRILGEVLSLTDVEKLLLYLKLPTGIVQDDQNRLTPTSCLPTSNRKEQGEASTWIKSHLEEHGDVCMPKAEVYDEYRQYCEQHELRPLCNADFGKMMKQVFPDINTRRLGQRGQSKYFYGGLKKKTDHTPPTLTELEVTAKNIEIDTNAMDSELFKSSCQVVCEWADKLLDSKFTGVQDIAEHLIANTFVNTKSVAAFTLIAAMQESGKYNLKDSALFSAQPSIGGDKHKETNLLLQRKLQQNKEIQKQKEKAQALREEIKSHAGSHGNQTRSKTPVTSQKKSETPSISLPPASVPVATLPSALSASIMPSKTLSTTSSPSPRQSPQVQQSPRKSVSPWLQQKTGHKGQMGNQGQTVQTGSKTNPEIRNCNVNLQQSVIQSIVVPVTQPGPGVKERSIHSKETGREGLVQVQIQKKSISENEILNKITVDSDGFKLLNLDYIDMPNNNCENEANSFEAKTPEICMETDQSELSHVRKIDFDDCVTEHHENGKQDDQSNKLENSEKKVVAYSADGEELSANKLSKSTGYLSLKKMLENKGEDQSILNKSMGCLGNSKNALFVNQSTIPGRSAFVPFSQVQSLCRKEGSAVNQSVAMAIPVIIPSVAQTQSSQTGSQSANITMIALPTDLQTSPTKGSSETFQKESFINILPASNIFQQPGGEIKIKTSATDSLPSINFQNQTKESTSVVTVNSVLSKMAGSECVVSSAQSFQNLPKQLRTKFTPIRPKASPNKAQPPKETKVEPPGYDKDKRPVSAILKEKRAKEQAEAIAKFQSSIRLPSIPFQQNISFTGSQLSGLQGINKAANSNVPASEVVIIVNNQQVKLQQVISSNTPSENQSIPKTTSSSIAGKESIKALKTNNKDIATVDVNYIKVNENSPSKSEASAGILQTNTVPAETVTDTKSTVENLRDIKEFSPMSAGSDITEIVCEDDDFNSLSEQDIDSDVNSGSVKEGSNEILMSEKEIMNKKISSEVVDQMWMETPRKIQKLNITSPFQDENPMTLGRETPIRISKTSDASRPDSACSYGRETPSGTRKRKSSDFHSRRNFKRLNSTGEENVDSHNLSLVLSPDRELSTSVIPRRTHSCTYELDRESKGTILQQQQQNQQQYKLNSVGNLLLTGLQSPDIHSLEQEALIESFPNSMYAMKPQQKSHRNQSNSIGVSAKSLRQSQQRLIKQQQYLDERVKNFLLTQSDSSETNISRGNSGPVQRNRDQQTTSQISPGSRASLKADSLVVSDRGKPYQRPSSVATVGNRGSNLEIEPSGLPSEVADWINETIEKRQKANQSAMSEPEFREYQSSKGDRNPKLQNFKFEVSTALNSRNKCSLESRSKNLKEKLDLKIPVPSQKDDNNFTVPKAPPVSNSRTKDMLRLNTDISSQRCQSLPIFASPVQSPVSPMGPLGGRVNMNQRASSMSPRAQALESGAEMMSPTTFGILSPVRRKEQRDGQVISPGQTALFPGQSKQGTYLASIQHSLQKPVDTLHEAPSPQDGSLGKHSLGGVVPGNKGQGLLANRSRESSLDADERLVSKTPFSDSGYHSSGPSPILNSTPVSAVENTEYHHSQAKSIVRQKQQITESSITMVTDYTTPQQLSPQQSIPRPQLSMHQQSVSIATCQLSNSSMNPGKLRSSIHSAFIPIQGSHHDVHYVAPIKPVVTLPNNPAEQNSNTIESDITGGIFIDTSQSMLASDITMVSPRSADPPSYEVAIKQLKKSTPPKPAVTNLVQPTEILPNIDIVKEQLPSYDQQQQQEILINEMGSETTPESLGPFAQKLIKLSQQSHSSGKDIQTLLRGEFNTNMASHTENQFASDSSDLTNLTDTGCGFLPNISTGKEIKNGASSDLSYTGDVNLCIDRQIPLGNPVPLDSRMQIEDQMPSDSQLSFEQRQTMNKSNSASCNVLGSEFPVHILSNNISSDNVLLNKTQFSMQQDLNVGIQRVANTEINLFNDDGAFTRNDNSGSIRNLLIGGKLISQELNMVVENADNKQDEGSQQELMEDIGLPWDSLREIEGDLDDLNMFS